MRHQLLRISLPLPAMEGRCAPTAMHDPGPSVRLPAAGHVRSPGCCPADPAHRVCRDRGSGSFDASCPPACPVVRLACAISPAAGWKRVTGIRIWPRGQINAPPGPAELTWIKARWHAEPSRVPFAPNQALGPYPWFRRPAQRGRLRFEGGARGGAMRPYWAASITMTGSIRFRMSSARWHLTW